MTKWLGMLNPAMMALVMSARETPGGANTSRELSGEMTAEPPGAASGMTRESMVAAS